MKKIVFVCTGNVCRSATAEYLLRKELDKKGITGIEVISRGIAANPAYRVPTVIKELLQEDEIDIEQHQSTLLEEDDVNSADLILVMDRIHLDDINDRYPEVKDKVFLFKEYAAAEGDKEIYDPIGLGAEVYKGCYQEIKNTVEKLVEKLRS